MQTQHTVIVLSQDDALTETCQQVFLSTDDYRIVLCRDENEVAQRLESMQAHLLIYDVDGAGGVDENIMVRSRLSPAWRSGGEFLQS